jgi:succinate dehydrogenase / fumarate reductase cytochrome b subunit
MVMSIVHRITGVALYFGTLLIVWWLVAAATGPDYFAFVNGLLATWPGMVIIVGFTWALIHHLLGGIRHLVWDAGHGFDLTTANRLAWATLIGSVTLTLVIWIVGYAVR